MIQFLEPPPLDSRPPNGITMSDKIIRIVAGHYTVSKSEILGTRRSKFIVRVRFVCIVLMRELTSMTLAQIGGVFSRDHTTIINALKSSELPDIRTAVQWFKPLLCYADPAEENLEADGNGIIQQWEM